MVWTQTTQSYCIGGPGRPSRYGMQRQGRKSSSESQEIKVQRTLTSNQLQEQPIKKIRCILKEILKDKMAENFPIVMNIKILDLERNKSPVR